MAAWRVGGSALLALLALVPLAPATPLRTTVGGSGFPPCLKTQGCLPPLPGTTDLFCPGMGAHCCYKIPSLLRVPPLGRIGSGGQRAGAQGLFLAFIEARRENCDDDGEVDLQMRRSADGGRTWSAAALVAGENRSTDVGGGGEATVTIGDALPVYDAVTGRVFLFFTRNNHAVFLQHSDDGGLTWTERANVTEALKQPLGNAWVGSGHANGLQLPSGRLVVPLYTDKSYAVVSDDHGATWRAGQPVPGVTGNEWDAAPTTANASVLLANIRNEHFVGSHRFTALSYDGGLSWGPASASHDLPSPVNGCEGATVLHPNGALYFSGVEKGPLREHLVVRKSTDGGVSWFEHTTVWEEAAGYSSMAVVYPGNASSDVALFYDRNNRTAMVIFEAQAVSFTTFRP